MKTLTLFVSIAVIGGCAATYTEPTLPPDHPANAGAAESPMPDQSHTLDLAGAEPVAPVPTGMKMRDGGMGSHGEDHDSMPTPAPGMPTMEGGGHKHEAPPPSPASEAVIYACPMHPEVTSDKPDQHCPKCGMMLRKVEPSANPAPSSMGGPR